MTDTRTATFAESLDSSAWGLLRGEMVRDIRRMSRMLIENVDMPEHERRGYQIAVRALKEGIKRVYDKAGRELPPTLRQELAFYQDEDDD